MGQQCIYCGDRIPKEQFGIFDGACSSCYTNYLIENPLFADERDNRAYMDLQGEEVEW